MQIREDFIPISKHSQKARRRGYPIQKVQFIVDHDTGNRNSTARNNVDYYKNTYNKAWASAHAFVDDREVVICIPIFQNPEKAWHVVYDTPVDNSMFGDDANDVAIGLELCYFDNKKRSLKAYENYINFAVDVCLYHGLDPTTRAGHFQLDPKNKIDPYTALENIGKTYTDMRNDILKEYKRRLFMAKYEDLTKIINEVMDSPEDALKASKALYSLAEGMHENNCNNDLEYWRFLPEFVEKLYKYNN